MTDLARIRNVAIIAHIDHGKSTLADRMIQLCGGLAEREMKEQVLDSMELERERGITIKAQTVRLAYRGRRRRDLPAQPDRHARPRGLSPTRSASLAACEGSLLLVDASQGVSRRRRSPTSTRHRPRPRGRPVLNKIDLPAAEPERVKQQIEEVIGLDASDARWISAKTGEGVPEVLEALVDAPAAARRRRRGAA